MTGPHQNQQLVTAATPVDDAEVALVLVHGRGATAKSIVNTMSRLYHEGVAALAPQAAGNTWYPRSFLEPVEHNEPGRSSGLQAIEDAIETATEAGIATDRVVVLGFSQGACLASDYVARNPRRYGGVVAFSGGLIGETVDGQEYTGDLEGMPCFVGCSDVDPHIPKARVDLTADVFEQLGAEVEKRIYEGMGHGVNEDEIAYVDGMIGSLL